MTSSDEPYFGYYTVDLFDCPPFIMFTNDDCPRARDIRENRQFEPASMKLWCRLAKDATGIADVGAHVGVYSLAAAALREDITIHAFEPNPLAYARLRLHKDRNQFHNIEEHWQAVGEVNGPTDLTWYEKGMISSGASILSEGVPDPKMILIRIPAQKIRLDDALPHGLGTRGLIKIDVEEAEVMTFNGMPRILASKPTIILESFNPIHCEKIDALVRPHGYRIYQIDEGTGRLKPMERVTAAVFKSGNYNQILSPEPLPESV